MRQSLLKEKNGLTRTFTGENSYIGGDSANFGQLLTTGSLSFLALTSGGDWALPILKPHFLEMEPLGLTSTRAMQVLNTSLHPWEQWLSSPSS